MLELSLKDETNLVDKMMQSMGIRFFKQNIGNYLSFVTIDNLHSLAPTIFMNGRTVDNGFFSTIINNGYGCAIAYANLLSYRPEILRWTYYQKRFLRLQKSIRFMI